jgi:hypothetical protein
MRFSVKGMAITIGVLWGASVLVVGVANLIWPAYGVDCLKLLASVYPGYSGEASLGQVVIGTLYGLVDGAIGGAIFAWFYNLVAKPAA